MMHKLLLYTAFLFLLTVPAAVVAGSPPAESVKLDVHLTPAMQPGTEGTIELRFTPAEGIHVNIDPPVAFSLDSGLALTLKGKPVMTKDPTTGYLSTSDPVRQTIVMGKNVRPGRITVKGTVTYFYCSDSEGWCNRQREPVEFTILVQP